MNRFREDLSRWFNLFGAIALILLTAIACLNMFMRIVGSPFKGAYELVGFFGALVVALPLGYAQINRAHIAVDILTRRYSRKTLRWVNAFNSLVCSVLFVLVAWQTGAYGTAIWKRGETSETLRIIYFPFVYVVGLCCLVLAFILLTDVFNALRSQKGDR
ncbi:MAG: TRAP transporter small permease [Desulfobacterota bacterium]|nr:TRAP transporter small permease [Thermodesulfobacteriota bacterium]